MVSRREGSLGAIACPGPVDTIGHMFAGISTAGKRTESKLRQAVLKHTPRLVRDNRHPAAEGVDLSFGENVSDDLDQGFSRRGAA